MLKIALACQIELAGLRNFHLNKKKNNNNSTCPVAIRRSFEAARTRSHQRRLRIEVSKSSSLIRRREIEFLRDFVWGISFLADISVATKSNKL